MAIMVGFLGTGHRLSSAAEATSDQVAEEAKALPTRTASKSDEDDAAGMKSLSFRHLA